MPQYVQASPILTLTETSTHRSQLPAVARLLGMQFTLINKDRKIDHLIIPETCSGEVQPKIFFVIVKVV
jgi:hypothetical protein